MRNIEQLKPHLERMAQSFGPYLRDYIDLEIQKNVNIMDCKSLKEMMARQEAVKMLKKIFHFVYSLENKGGEVQKTSYK